MGAKKRGVTKRRRGRPAKTGWEDRFFEHLACHGNKGCAAKAAGVSIATVGRQERRDQNFREHVAFSVEDQRLERLRRRGDLLGMLRILRPEAYGSPPKRRSNVLIRPPSPRSAPPGEE